MKTSYCIVLSALVLSLTAFAQAPPPPAGPPGQMERMGQMDQMGRMGGPDRQITIHREMGKWWENSELAKKLQLSDQQISSLNQTFYDHRLKLIDYGAAMEKEDLKLQNLLDADVPNEAQVGSQVDQVLAARGKLEREYTMMNLDLRKVLSVEQWRQLKSIRHEREPGGDVFFQRRIDPGSGPVLIPAPPAPGPGGDMF